MPKVRDVIHHLEREGWVHVRTRGSHRVYKHLDRPMIVTVPGHPRDEIAPGTWNSIQKQAGWKDGGQKVKRYTVIVEKAPNNYSAYVPDLPGCITTGNTVDEVVANMEEAIAVHLETMADLGIPIPEPTTSPDILPSDGEFRLVEVAD